MRAGALAPCRSLMGPRPAAPAMMLVLGAVLYGLPSFATAARTEPLPVAPPTDHVAAFVSEASRRFGIPARWIHAVMRAESAGDARAISKKGAMGLMQIMPATWSDLRARHRLGADPFDPSDNIMAGTAYLRELHDRYGSPGFLAAYNAGPGRYEALLAGGPLPTETRAYVATLAPLVSGGTRAPTVRVAASHRRAWTRAPLFVTRLGRGGRADSKPSDRGRADARSWTARLEATQSDRLFVVRSAAGGLR